jgi:hypothetical protein
MKKLKCYYAHTMTSYNSTIEAQDIELLETLGFEVMNPNTDVHQQGCKDYAFTHGVSKVMNYFVEFISTQCDVVAFRALPNGQILSGVATEVDAAITLGIPVIELPCSVRKRMMDYSETKQYLIELGHYKVKA